jgi:hypothetical protein
MILFGCLLAVAAAFAPRIVLLIMWIVGPRVNAAFNNWLLPLLGLLFAPYTTIMYVLSWNPVTGISGWDWLWIGLGVWLDVMKWGRVFANRKNIPGMQSTSAEETPEIVEPAPAVASTSDELGKLAQLRDQGVLTDEEFEAKKKQLLDS